MILCLFLYQDCFLLFSCQNCLGLCHNVGSCQAKPLLEVSLVAHLAELVLHTHHLHGNGGILYQHFGYGTAQAIDHTVVLTGDDGAGLSGSQLDELRVNGLQCAVQRQPVPR